MGTTRTIFATSALLTILAASQSRAQESVQQLQDRDQAAPLASKASSPSGLQISAENGASKVVLKLGFDRSTPRNDGFLYEVLSFIGDGPVGTPGQGAQLASLDGAPSGTSFSLDYRRLSVSHVNFNVPSEAAVVCQADKEKELAELKGAPLPTFENCFKRLTTQHPHDATRLLKGVPVSLGDLSVWGFTGKVDFTNFDYVNPVTLASVSEQKTPWSAGLYAMYYPIDSTNLITLSAKYRDDYQAQDSATLCPSPAGAPLKCITGAVGAPKHVTRELLSAEYRKSFGLYAVAATVTYDAKNDVTGIDLPIYFVPDATGGLTGGIKLGWRSDTKDTTAGVFIGKPFRTLPF